jgi:hypothetical protein
MNSGKKMNMVHTTTVTKHPQALATELLLLFTYCNFNLTLLLPLDKL